MKNIIAFFLFCAAAAFAGPFDASWAHYRTVTVNTATAGVTGTVTNFPLLVRLTNADSAHGADVLSASATGADLRFTDSTGNISLSYQVERWTTSAAEIWVSMPSILGSSSTSFRMYWGNSSATSASSGVGVFDASNGFVGVWHLGDAAGINPRPNQVTGAPAATPWVDTVGGSFGGGAGVYVVPNGMIGLADSVRGGGTTFTRSTSCLKCDYLDIGSATSNTTTPYTGNNTYTGYSNFTTGYTFSVWFKPAVSSIASYQYFSMLGNATNAQDNIQEYRQSATRQVRLETLNGTVSTGNNINNTTTNTWTAGTWTHLTVTFGGHATAGGGPLDTMRIYVNGVAQTLNGNGIAAAGSGISNVLRTNAWLGKSNYTGDGYIQGVYDEPEISNVVRSPDWAKLSYQTQINTQTAVTLGTAQVPTGGTTAPTPPTSVSAVAGNAQATVSWSLPLSNGGVAISGYTATAVQDTSKHCATTTALTCTISGLTNGTAYTFTVTATNSIGTSSASSPSASVTPITVASAPTGVTGIAGNGQVVVVWTNSGSNGGSAITNYTATAAQDTSKHCASASGVTCTVTGLTNGTSYTFTVIATNAAGNSAASSPSASLTPATIPGVPTGVTDTAGNAQVKVVWIAPSSNGGSAITAYTVVSVQDTSKHCTTTGSLTCTINNLTNGTAYSFTVTATNVVGTSAASGASTTVTPVAPVGAPNAPTGAAATVGNGRATVSWAASTTNGSAVTGYLVTSSPDGKTCSTTGALTCVDSTLTNGTSYTFTIIATSLAGNSAASVPSIAIIPVGVPGVPTGVTGVGTSGQVAVSWVAPTSTGGSSITGYTATAVQDTSKHCTTTTLTCNVTGLTNTTAYTFTVVATNIAGTSAISVPSPSVTSVFFSSNPNSNSKEISVHMTGSSLQLLLPEITGTAQISIVDLWGREVWNQTVGTGVREVSWGRGTSSGRSVVPGIYIVRVMLQDAGHKSRLAAESKILLTP